MIRARRACRGICGAPCREGFEAPVGEVYMAVGFANQAR